MHNRLLMLGLTTCTLATLCAAIPLPADETPAPGTIVTVAGTGKDGFSGDGASALEARLSVPAELAVDGTGNLLIADFGNNRIRKVTRDGVITTVAGTGEAGFSGDNGPATLARLNGPVGLAVDTLGNLFIGDLGNNRIRRVDPGGIIATVAGGGAKTAGAAEGGPALEAKLNLPHGVAVDRMGDVYFVEPLDYRVREVSAGGIITTVAGSGKGGFSGDNGPAVEARLNLAYSLAVDRMGNLFIGDAGNNRVRMVRPDGIISTIAGGGKPADGLGDGDLAAGARLNGPLGLAVDGGGNLFIADNRNRRVRKVDLGGTITTVAGNGKSGFSGEGGPAADARLSAPWGLAVDRAGDLFIADSALLGTTGIGITIQNNRVREVYGVAVPD